MSFLEISEKPALENNISFIGIKGQILAVNPKSLFNCFFFARNKKKVFLVKRAIRHMYKFFKVMYCQTVENLCECCTNMVGKYRQSFKSASVEAIYKQ